MLFTSLSLGSLDHKLEDNAIYPVGILWMLISQISKIFTPLLYVNPVTIILWYDIIKCEFCYIASQQKRNALEKEDIPVILKSRFMLFKVSPGWCSRSGKSMPWTSGVQGEEVCGQIPDKDKATTKIQRNG